MSRIYVRLAAQTLVLLTVSWLAACSSIPMPAIYKIDVQQGNVVSEDMLARLEPGMEKRKVRFLLGTPLIDDTFNEDRWHYLYSLQKGHRKREQRLVVIVFEDDRLKAVEGDVVRGEARAQVERPEVMVSVPDYHGGTVFGRLANAFGGDRRESPKPKSGDDETRPDAVATTKEVEATTPSEAKESASTAEQETVEGDERGLFSKLKSMFGEDEASVGATAEPVEEPFEDGVVPDAEIVGSTPEPKPESTPDAAEPKSSLFTRLKEKFAREEPASETASAGGETVEGDAGSEMSTGDAGDAGDESGFFARLKKRLATDEESEPEAPAEENVADEGDGFFKRLSKRFGLGSASAAETEERTTPPGGE